MKMFKLKMSNGCW